MKGITARIRAAKSRRRKAHELSIMQEVRELDGYCRFPECDCGCPAPRERGYPLEVSHRFHRGMGGNPAGDRTTPGGLILLCRPRHQGPIWSVDRGTLRWLPLTEQLSRGPVVWQVHITLGDLMSLYPDAESQDPWQEIAREIAPHIFEPRSVLQAQVLARIREDDGGSY